MKRLPIIFVSVLALTGCGNASTKAFNMTKEVMKADEAALQSLNAVKEKEEEFLTLMSDIFIEGEESFDKANELIPQATELLKQLDDTLEEQGTKLKLSEKKIEKMEALMEELNGEEASVIDAFLTYKNNLTVYLETKMSVMDSYETFLSQISSDIAFKDMELMITSLNTGLKAVTAAYEEYEQSAYDFSTKYEKFLGE